MSRPPAPAWNQAAAAWDAGRGVLVLFGGDYAPRETWEWNGSSWRNATPALSSDSPPASQRHVMAYDPIGRRVLSLGGNGTADLWAWDGTRWQILAVAGTPPAARLGHSLAWDDQRGELVVHGGWLGADLSVWDGRTYVLRTEAGVPTWHDVTPDAGPFPRSYDAAGWDPGRRRVLLVRFPVPAAPQPAEVRFWGGSDAREWRLLDVADPEGDGDPGYPGRERSAIAFNRTRDVTVYHRTFPSETWEWNRVSWARRADDSAPIPGERFGFALGSHGADVILFGGELAGVTQGDTWRWSASGWQQLIPSPDPATATTDAFREYAGMAEDPDTGRLFRFGGCVAVAGLTCFPDVWEWTGLAWSRLGGEPWDDPEGDGSPLAADAPWADWYEGGVVWDRDRGSLLFARTMLHVYWEWQRDAASWIRHEIVPNWPGPDTVRFFLYDATLGAPVVLADNGAWEVDLAANEYRAIPLANVDGISRPSDGRVAFDEPPGKAVVVAAAPLTWEGGTAGGPAHLLHVDFSRANGPDPAVCAGGAACPIQRIDVRWTGGGSGPWGDGATLRAWTGEWSQALPFPAPASAPATFTWTWLAGSAVPASTLFHGAARELTFALAPDSFTTAAGRAQVATDALSVTVRYRRP